MGKKKKDKIVPKTKKEKKNPEKKKTKSKKDAEKLFLDSIYDLSLKDLKILFNTNKYTRKAAKK